MVVMEMMMMMVIISHMPYSYDIRYLHHSTNLLVIHSFGQSIHSCYERSNVCVVYIVARERRLQPRLIKHHYDPGRRWAERGVEPNPKTTKSRELTGVENTAAPDNGKGGRKG